MKSVLVTGAASGLGRNLTLMYAGKGYTVYAVDIDGAGLEKLPESGAAGADGAACAGGAGGIIPLRIDIASEREWDEVVVPAVEKGGGGLDIVVACAAVMRLGSALDCPLEDWQFVCNVNLTAQFITAKKTLPFLKKNKGNILFIGSPSAKLAVRDEVCYVTFKHAICGLSKSVAFDFGEAGVRSNVLHPGWMRTAMSDQEMQEIMDRDGVSLDEAYDIVTRFVPLKRAGSLDEICQAADFLTSDQASYISGAELMADGALTIVDPGMVGFL
jgi:NAD(P)-dependent dehydrogenase (short-subunit alcohol dehydrogenase family)